MARRWVDPLEDPMKTLILGLLATAALATALPAAAQPQPGYGRPSANAPYGPPAGRDGPPPGRDGQYGGRDGQYGGRDGQYGGRDGAWRGPFGEDFRRIGDQIQRGEQSRRLNHFDANRFQDELRLIQSDVREYMRDDRHMSRTQEKKTQKRLDRLSNMIRDAEQNGRGRR
jgi:hypothetical protein